MCIQLWKYLKKFQRAYIKEYTTIFFIVDYYRNKYNGYRVFKYLTLLITLPEDYENIIVVNYVYLITNFLTIRINKKKKLNQQMFTLNTQ